MSTIQTCFIDIYPLLPANIRCRCDKHVFPRLVMPWNSGHRPLQDASIFGILFEPALDVILQKVANRNPLHIHSFERYASVSRD